MGLGDLNLEGWFDRPTPEMWEEEALRLAKGRPLSSMETALAEGVRLPVLHGVEAAVGAAWPDAAPFTRGQRVLDRRSAGWDIRQRHATGTIDEAAHRVAYDVSEGARSLMIVPDGVSRGLEGRPGVPLRGLSDVLDLLGAVDLRRHPVDIRPGRHASAWLAALVQGAREVGVPAEQLTGAVAFDPMGLLAREGRLASGWSAAMDELAEMIRWADGSAPWVHLVGIDATHVAAAGGHRVHQMAWSLAVGAEILREMSRRGVGASQVARRVLLRVATGRETFADMAMLRALRTGWATLLDAWQVPSEACGVYVHAMTGVTTSTRFDPWVNVLRATAETFAAATGGADAVTVLPFDVRLGATDEAAHRLARTTQLALAEEAHLARVADPAGGSWAVERLTRELGERSWALLQEIEAAGGLLQEIVTGRWATRMGAAATARAARVATRKQPILGVSVQPHAGEELPARDPVLLPADVDVVPVDCSTLDEAMERLTSGASIAAVGAALMRSGPDLEAPVAGEALPHAAWEALRQHGEASNARVLLVGLGPQSAHTARVDWVRQVWEAAGFTVEMLTNPPDSAAVVARCGEAHALCLAGQDEAVESWAPTLVGHAPWLAVTGRGEPLEGVVRLFAGADLLASMEDMVPDGAEQGVQP